MKGCNRLAEQARKRIFRDSDYFKDMCGGRPEAQAKDINTARAGRNQGEGGGCRWMGEIQIPIKVER